MTSIPEPAQPRDYLAEWKWDGIRVQLVHAGGETRLYSRTGDDVSQSFPDIAGTSVPVLDPHTGNTSYLRLSRREVVERREQNEARWRHVLDTFDFLDIEPVILSSARPDHILDAFIWWSEKRLHWRVTL